jgi:predicted metal-dependent hydrolase
MLDWLRRNPREVPVLEIGGRALPVVVRRLERARRMTLRLAPDGSEVRVSIPRWTPTADALGFARSRQDWLARQIATLPEAAPVQDGTAISHRGAVLLLRHVETAPRRVRREGETLHIGGPPSALAGRVKRWLEAEARAVLAEDLTEYCARAGRAVPKLALSGAQRRWGSCAADGSIRLNWRLIMAPDFVRRSVVAHEVAHLAHFDHSPAFHAFLGSLFEGDVDDANRWLKLHGRSLYQPFG